MITYNELVPADLADRLIAIRDSSTHNSWETGDITEQVVQYCARNRIEVEVYKIYAAVGVFVGKSSRTVREKHYIAKFYSPEVRELYSVLSYDHFRVAIRLGPKWRDALEWAVKQTDELNRPCSVDSMMAKFAIVDPGMPEPPPLVVNNTPYEMIFSAVNRQLLLVEGWIGYDLGKEVSDRLQTYYRAAKELKEAIEQEHCIRTNAVV